MDMPPPINPITIFQFIEILNETLKPLETKIIGEITKLTIASSGHVYFTLKDKEKDAVLDCIIWKRNYELNGIDLESGMEIIATGRPSIYANSGRLSFVAQTVERVGEGALKEAYLKLKIKLTQEGLFAEERKRPLPTFPHRIGVITSKQGAVIHDFTNNVGLHGFDIRFLDSRVEGQEALIDLISAIRSMKKQSLDVLVIMRGGGSLQSLAAFDNEKIVREISQFPVPVIAAIGHHEDITLTALAADFHVSTPTAAANLLHTQWLKPKELLTELTYQIFSTYQEELRSQSESLDLDIIKDRYLTKFLHILSNVEYHLSLHGEERIFKNFSHGIETYGKSVENFEHVISLNDPLNVLKKGYSIIQHRDKLIKSVHDVVKNDQLLLRVKDGVILSKVESTKEETI